MSWNLNEDVEDGWEFSIGGNVYYMRYPTTEEIDRLAEPPTDGKTSLTGWVRGLIEARTEGAPDIEEALQKSNIQVLRKFNLMVQVKLFGKEDPDQNKET